jgi:DNA-binding transcriptional LysR family regulator
MPEPLKLRRLEHLLFLADERNFARTAEVACLSQSAFSRSIQALEDSLGLRLVDRGQRQVELTSAGRRLSSRARRLLASTNDMQRELEMLRRGDLGDISVGAGPFTAVAIFPKALADLRVRHPAINVRLDVDNWSSLLRRLRSEQLDFFVSDIREIAQAGDIAIQPLCTLTGSLFCRPGHPLLAKQPLEFADLATARFASVNMPALVRSELFMHMAPYSGGGFPIVLECESAAVTREFALQTDVVVISCREVLRLELECGALQELVVRPLLELGSRTPLRTETGVVRLSGRSRSPASELLLESLRTQAEQLRVGQGLSPTRTRLATETSS